MIFKGFQTGKCQRISSPVETLDINIRHSMLQLQELQPLKKRTGGYQRDSSNFSSELSFIFCLEVTKSWIYKIIKTVGIFEEVHD